MVEMAHIIPPKEIKGLKNSKTKGVRKRWKDADGNIFEWDSMHGTLEKYDKHGRHLGEYDLELQKLKPADKTRRIEP